MKKYLYILLIAPIFSMAQVGINTTTPAAQLDIKSSNQAAPANTDGILIPKIDTFPAINPTAAQKGMLIYLTTASGTNPPGFYYWNNPGWVGISSDSSAWKITGNSGTNQTNNFIGTIDNQNVVFKRFNTLSGLLSNANTVFGYSAFNSGSSGTANTAIGIQSLSSNSTGASNTASGFSSLISNTTGGGNTANGDRSLFGNTTGMTNTANGFQALFSNTTGNLNTAIGANSDVFSNNLSNATAIGAMATVATSNALVLGSVSGINGAGTTVNVGIGTIAPADRLHVVGNIRMVDGNQAAGKVFTSDANGTGTWQNASANAWGLNGNSGTNSATNFIGTTDNQDLVFKRFALWSGALGTTNTSFGLNALNPSTTGTENTAIGVSALASNTIGSVNTAIGLNTLASNTTGSFNTANGRNALRANTIGTSNTAIGHGVLPGNNVGSDNTAIGSDALFLNSSGSFNTAVGRQALTGNITGTANTALGYGSDVAASNLTNATAIGANAEVNTSNSLVLGSITGVNGATSNVNVGIGTTTPADRLHVVGNIRMVDGNQAAGKVLTSDANGTATWTDASANAWGVNGNSAISDLTNFIGTTNSADLVFRRNNIESGRLDSSNTSFGVSSLVSNTTGFKNSAYGLNALNANTTGFLNSAFGDSSLLSNTIGTNNSAFGVSALRNNDSGVNNVGVGRSALEDNLSGDANTGVGHYSLVSNTTGNNNVAVGHQSLMGNTTGQNNVACGLSSLRTNTTGLKNTAIGADSDVASASLTNATAIGAMAEVGASNSLVLGSISGVNGATSSVNVGIGTTTPADKLHVVGNIRMVDGNQAAGKVLTSDANGTATWTAPGAAAAGTLDQSYDFGGAGAGRTITADTGAVTIEGFDGLVSTGTSGTGAFAPSGSGTRMVWNPRKAAFRAGTSLLTGWDDANIGGGSASFGYGTVASGNFSTSFGRENTAPSFGETVLGIGATTYATSVNGATQFRAANGTDRLLVVGNAIDANNNNSLDAAERSDALVILKNGNTGIGSSTPEERLHVVGKIRMVDGNEAPGNVMVSDANGTATWAAPGVSTAGTLDQSYDFGGAGAGRTITADAGPVTIAGTDGLTVSGNSGFGVTTPVSRMQLQTTSSATKTQFTQALPSSGLLITTDYIANNYTPGLFWSTTNNSVTKPKAGVFLRETALGTFMHFGTSNSYVTGITNDAMILDPEGNVGIGITTPATALDLAGAMTVRPFALAALTADNQVVTVGNNGNIWLSSNSFVVGARTITLSDGLIAGQFLTLYNSGISGDFEVADDAINRNTNTAASRTLGNNDVMTLMWNGNDWVEVSYTNN